MSSGQEVGDIFEYGKGPATALLRSPTVVIASIALWGMNILLFRMFGIDHVRVLTAGIQQSDNESEKDALNEKENENFVDTDESAALKENSSSSSEITASKCFLLSAILFLLLNTTTYVWMDVLEGRTIGAILFFYLVVLVGVVTPLKQTQWIRDAAKVVFHRATELLNPRCSCLTGDQPIPIPFIDVFFADGMCSLSKVFFDLGMLWHLASHFPNEVPHSAHNIIIPSCFAALPYLIRARQCLVMFNIGQLKNDSKRYQHFLNAIKYSTSLFPICLSAYQKTVSDDVAEDLEYYLILLLIVNSVYSYAWDIIMDWGMMQNPTAVIAKSCSPNANLKSQGCADVVLRPRLRFGCSLSTLILVADGVFRFGWVLRFYESDIFPSLDSYILFTELLEVFRRAIWNLLRVEWENLKQTKHLKESLSEDDETSNFLSTGSVQMVPGKVTMRSTV